MFPSVPLASLELLIGPDNCIPKYYRPPKAPTAGPWVESKAGDSYAVRVKSLRAPIWYQLNIDEVQIKTGVLLPGQEQIISYVVVGVEGSSELRRALFFDGPSVLQDDDPVAGAAPASQLGCVRLEVFRAQATATVPQSHSVPLPSFVACTSAAVKTGDSKHGLKGDFLLTTGFGAKTAVPRVKTYPAGTVYYSRSGAVLESHEVHYASRAALWYLGVPDADLSARAPSAAAAAVVDLTGDDFVVVKPEKKAVKRRKGDAGECVDLT